jgi:hypothetical protein
MRSALAYKYDDDYEGDEHYQDESIPTKQATRRRVFTQSLPFVVVAAADLEDNNFDSYAHAESEQALAVDVEADFWPSLPTNETLESRQWTSGSPLGVAAPSSFSATPAERHWSERNHTAVEVSNPCIPAYNKVLRPRRVHKAQPNWQSELMQDIRQTALEVYSEVRPARKPAQPQPEVAAYVQAPAIPTFGDEQSVASSSLNIYLSVGLAWLNYHKKFIALLVLVVAIALIFLPIFVNKSTNEQLLAFGESAIGVNAGSGLQSGAMAKGDNLLGAPTITPEQIEQVLRQYHSPAQGAGQTMYDLGLKYGIDPAYPLAFFIHESSAGTQGVATVTKSIGNIRVTPGYDSYAGFRKYATWEAGMEDWYKLIKDLYIDSWHLTTLQAIIPRYAPSADHNDPLAYINQVHNLVATWRGVK